MGVSQLKTGPESELVLLPENSRTEVGEGWGARPGGWGAFGTIERTWAGFVSWLCLTAPSSCLPSFGMFAGRSDAFGDTCSGCTVRRGLCVSDPELAGGEHTLLTEVVKPAKKKPAEAASPTASACAAFTANPSWQPGVVMSSCVSPRAGAGSRSTVFPEPGAGDGPQPTHNTGLLNQSGQGK